MGSKEQKHKMSSGVIVPMVTPLTSEGELDEAAVRRIVDFLVAGGVQGIFVLGTTGEGPSAPRELRSRLVHLTVEHAAGRAGVFAGIYDTVVSESERAAREYLRRGVTAVVAALPGYYTLSPDEQFHYFTGLAERIRGPLLMYDIPAAVHQSIDLGVIEHLRAFPNVIGIKDSSVNHERLTALLSAYAHDDGFAVLVGATALASYGLRNGADGFIPSVANINPALCARLYASAVKGDYNLMADLQREVDALQSEFVVEDSAGHSIARLKKRMAQQGLCGPRVFSPLEQED